LLYLESSIFSPPAPDRDFPSSGPSGQPKLRGGGAGEVRIRTRDGDITLRDGR